MRTKTTRVPRDSARFGFAFPFTTDIGKEAMPRRRGFVDQRFSGVTVKADGGSIDQHKGPLSFASMASTIRRVPMTRLSRIRRLFRAVHKPRIDSPARFTMASRPLRSGTHRGEIAVAPLTTAVKSPQLRDRGWHNALQRANR